MPQVLNLGSDRPSRAGDCELDFDRPGPCLWRFTAVNRVSVAAELWLSQDFREADQ